MTKGEGIKIMAVGHWMGEASMPSETSELIASCKVGFGYFLAWDVLEALTEKYDVQLSHQTILLGNHKIRGLRLMLDQAGRGHRQR